jgi:hypothetical protein
MSTEKINNIVGKVLADMEKKFSGDVDAGKTSGSYLHGDKDRAEADFISGGGRNTDIESAWMRIIDDGFKAHSYVEGIYKDRLFVKIDSSCYLSAFNMQKRGLLKKIHEAGFTGIKQIEFRI